MRKNSVPSGCVKIAQIYYYDPQSAGINLKSPQSDSTPWTLTLAKSLTDPLLVELEPLCTGAFFTYFLAPLALLLSVSC